jgi:hypothetical protein
MCVGALIKLPYAQLFHEWEWLWFGTPNIHSPKFSLSFARHWHGSCAQVYLSIHSKIVGIMACC